MLSSSEWPAVEIALMLVERVLGHTLLAVHDGDLECCAIGTLDFNEALVHKIHSMLIAVVAIG